MKIKNIAVGLFGVMVLSTFSVALTIKTMGQLSYPLDQNDKKIIQDVAKNQILPESVSDVNWNKYLYLFDWVVPPDASLVGGTWALTTSGGTWSFGGSDFTLKTGTTTGSYVGMYRSPHYQSILRWDRIQKFRTSFQISSIKNQIAYIVRGKFINASTTGVYYGFKVLNDSLYGVTENGLTGTESSIFLTKISTDTTIDVQAIFTPGQSVVFYIKNLSGAYISLGSLYSNLPVGSVSMDFGQFFIKNTSAEDKHLSGSYFEYLQQR